MNMVKCLAICTILTGCGTYFGSEKISYNPNEMVGFLTIETELQHVKDLKASYDAGKADEVQPEVKPIDDGSVTILDEEQISELGGGVVNTAVAWAGPLGFLVLLGASLLKRRA